MKLDPRESINNMGTLRVDVLDAADLPSADRNGYSDPYCKFKLNGKDVFKTKVQKKTLHPAWNEFFECSVKSRIGADMRLEVYDWDFGDKADHLGGTNIDLEHLEPFHATEVSYPLDGKSGAVRLKLLFKPVYVMRSRQGSSTFSGTFATPGKIVGAPVKGVGIVGGGVIKGASFIKNSLLRRGGSKDDDDNRSITAPEPSGSENLAIPTMEVTPSGTPQRASVLVDGAAPPLTPTPSTPQTPHSRSRSIASQFGDKIGRSGGGGKGDTGTANFTIISAAGYPSGTNVRVTVKQMTSKGAKEVHKTKAIKSAHHSGTSTATTTPTVQFDPANETFKVPNVAADAQFQLQVKDHATFGSDEVLGEALFFVDDQGSSVGKEHTIKVGSGTITLKSAFSSAETSSLRPGTSYSTAGDKQEDVDSPERKPRRSFLAKRSVSGAVPNGG